MAESLLDLTTLIEQPTIKINGELYEILHPDQLGVIDFQRLASMGSKVADLLKKSEPDDDDAAQLNTIIVDLTDRIMPRIPLDVRAQLTESQRLLVAEVFMTLPRVQTRKRTQAKTKEPIRLDGSKQRSDASVSTAATQSGG